VPQKRNATHTPAVYGVEVLFTSKRNGSPMASILPEHAAPYTPEPPGFLSKIVSCYKAIGSWMREAWLGPCIRAEQAEVFMNIDMRTQIVQEQALREQAVEEHLRSLWFNRLERQFSYEEIVLLCKLRDHYQHGGSDREEVIRRLSFVKYLHEQHLIES